MSGGIQNSIDDDQSKINSSRVAAQGRGRWQEAWLATIRLTAQYLFHPGLFSSSLWKVGINIKELFVHVAAKSSLSCVPFYLCILLPCVPSVKPPWPWCVPSLFCITLYHNPLCAIICTSVLCPMCATITFVPLVCPMCATHVPCVPPCATCVPLCHHVLWSPTLRCPMCATLPLCFVSTPLMSTASCQLWTLLHRA